MPKTNLRIQVDKNAKCNIIHSFCFELFFLSIMSSSYFKYYHGTEVFQLDDEEQKW